MNLQAAIELYAGGPGSGCNPDKGKCGRPAGSGAGYAKDTDVKFVYHIAPREARASILENGVDPTRSLHERWSSGKGFHGFKDLEEARWYARTMSEQEPKGLMDIWKVKVTGELSRDASLTSDPEQETTAVYHDKPSKRVKLVR